MRIGIMLRSFDEKGGVGVYTRNIVKELLQLDSKNEYILFYANPINIGLFSHHSNVKERWLKGSNKAYWDQIAIPRACCEDQIDVLFHPKFTAPLLAPCPVVMTVHGADWFIPDQALYYTFPDILYMRIATPLYFKKCSTIISVTQSTTDDFNQVLHLPPNKMCTVYFAPARHFRRVTDKNVLQTVKARYALPERFILTLTKRQGDRRKNLGQIFEAYALYHKRTANPSKLVVGGKDCHLFRHEYCLPNDGFGRDVIFPGWFEQTDLPAIYSLADLYLYPSNLESASIPIMEAMACGTPILTSNVNGTKEIAGDAALLVDPRDTVAIADAIRQILSDSVLQRTLSERGLVRAQRYSWDACAEKTLNILMTAALTQRVKSEAIR
jgi:O-antigen biosynthesis alpha-1,2-mannosyltransferase